MPRHDVTDLAEERHEFPIALLLSALLRALGARDPAVPPGPASTSTVSAGTASARSNSPRGSHSSHGGALGEHVAGILLAAGDGSRLGQPKATIELAGSTLAERGVALLRDGGTDPVIVVTGAIPVEIPGVVSVHNPDWLTGMGSSLATGLRALAKR